MSEIGVTKRTDVIKELGTGFAYPAKGWTITRLVHYAAPP